MTLDGSLRCCNLEQMLLLIKSSDSCMDTLNQAADDEIPFSPVLCLRQWAQIERSMEFRCFVKNRSLIAICQRDMTFYKFLLELHGSIKDRISAFFAKNIRDKFSLSDCAQEPRKSISALSELLFQNRLF